MPGILLTYPPAAAAAPFYRSSASADFGSCMHGQNIFTSDFVAEGSCIGNVPGGTFDVFASASARPGVLAALAGVDLNNVVFAGQTFVQADGFAAFSDILTLSKTPPGSKASFTFDVGGIGAAAMHDIHGVQQIIPPTANQGPTHKLITYNEVVTPGQPLAIDFSLDVQVGLACKFDPDNFNENVPFACNEYVTYDFTDPATLTSVKLLDANGNPIPDIVIASASGFDYNNLSPAPAAIAEPASGAVLGAALFLMGLLRRHISGRAEA